VPPSDSDRDAALAIVSETVTERFALTLSAYVDRLLAILGRTPQPDDTPPEPLRRLHLDDLYLAIACTDGDEGAWREFERRYFGFMRSFATRFLPPQQADEVVGQAIADLWQRGKIGQFEGRSSLRTWLGAVVTRAALNAAAVHGTQPASLDDDRAHSRAERLASSSSAGDRDHGRLLADLLRRSVERLDDEDRLLVLLHYEQELTLEQMQPAMGVSKATLSRRLKRVRERLRDELAALLRSETGEQSIDVLKSAIDDARLEFDLSSALRRGRPLQGKPRGTV
jgi:RNA polymerase sigma-70 factor (ECF subfamily)